MTEELKKEIKSWTRLIAIAIIGPIIINSTLLVNAKVPTGSMESTVMTGDRIFGNRLAYAFSEPKRGNVIVFKFPDDESQDYLKRIIGLPGETLEIIDGKVYINQSVYPLEESYLEVIPQGSYGPVTIPENCYFVMGDNRNDSWDSRYWKNTFVTRDKILARAILDYFPIPHIIN